MKDPADYKFIRAWGILMKCERWYIEKVQKQAANDNAPLISIYKSILYGWQTHQVIRSEWTIKKLNRILKRMNVRRITIMKRDKSKSTKAVSTKKSQTFGVTYNKRDMSDPAKWKLDIETKTFANQTEADEFAEKVNTGKLNTKTVVLHSARKYSTAA